MQSWENGKKELQREFTRICTLLDENIFAEINDSSTVQVKKEELCLLRENSARIEKLVKNNARLVDELESCKVATSRIDLLEKENEKLAAELEKNVQKLASTNESKLQSNLSSAQKSSSPSLPAEGIPDVSEFKRLARKYNVVSENCNQLQAAWVKMQEKLREQKKKSREWAQYLEKKDTIIQRKSDRIRILEQEVKKLNSRLGDNEGIKASSSSKTVSNSLSHSVGRRLEFSLKPQTNDGTSKNHQNSSLLPNKPDGLKLPESASSDHKIGPDRYMQEKRYSPTSTDTNISVKSAENPPTEVASELINVKDPDQNSVQRSSISHEEPTADKIGSTDHHLFTLASERTTKRKERSGYEEISGFINEEINNNNNLLSTCCVQYLKDSIDLDDIGEKFDTPKKRYKYNQQPSKPTNKTDSLLVPEDHQESRIILDHRDMSEKLTSRGKSNFSPNLNMILKKNGSVRGITENSESSALRTNMEFPSEVMASSATSSCSTKRKANKFKGSSKSKLHGNRESSLLFQNLVPNVNAKISSPESSSLIASPSEFIKTSSEPRSPSFNYTTRNKSINSADLSFPASSSSPSNSSLIQHASHRHFKKSKKTEFQKGKLRAQPIGKLDLRDFKINPNYNQGYDYAFSEVVRGHARNGLQGCLKPCCQPQFRALAEISENPSKITTFSQEEADNLMLEEFLGDNAYKLRQMSKEDRVELLIQAKTRDLANKHGIHRHAYENPETPVGIWRADFPTTQEAFEDDMRILERTRRIVEKRYAEAMRPGGAYKFRDE